MTEILDRRDDPEWDALEELWRTEERVAPFDETALRRRIGAQTRRMWYITAMEAVIVVATLLASLFAVRRDPTRFTMAWTASVWVFTLFVWEFAMWNRRGVWKPFGATAAAFVQLMRERAKRKIRVVWFCRVVIPVSNVAFLPIAIARYRAQGLENFRTALMVVFLLYSAGVVIWSVWYRRQAERELRDAAELEQRVSRET
jgi:hypothetical protein